MFKNFPRRIFADNQADRYWQPNELLLRAKMKEMCYRVALGSRPAVSSAATAAIAESSELSLVAGT
jgi:hypothetical protein